MNQDIPAGLMREARRQLELPQLAQALQAHLGERSASCGRIETRLHPNCQMLAHSLRHLGDAGLAVSQYYGIALQQFHSARQLIAAHRVPADRLQFLDFACGYGRLLNFLVHLLPPHNIHAAEIMPEAVRHVGQRYGVRTLQSTGHPEDFHPGTRHDLIWVASLFSHLPRALFVRWLRRLAGLLSEQGVLCFTVHDQALLPAYLTMPDDGLLYIQGSENATLSPEIYGTTFVSEDFVRSALAEALGPDCRYRRYPRLIAYEQDVYLVGAEGRDLPAAMDRLRHGLRGWVDGRRLEKGRLHLHGWAASMDGDSSVRVEVNLAGRVHTCATGEPRPEVARVLNRADLAYSGWSIDLEIPQVGRETYLTVSVRGEHDAPGLLFAGPLARPAHTG